MLITVAVAGFAGWGTRLAEARLTRFLQPLLGEEALADGADARVAALLLALAGAAVALQLLEAQGSILLFCLSALVGYFFDLLKARFFNAR